LLELGFSNKETTDTASSASFLDLYLEFDDWSTQYSNL
jgi:hypothetical protein